MIDKDFYGGLICLYIFYYVVEEFVFGLGIIEELCWYGYEMSVGIVYLMLYGLEKKGYLILCYECIGWCEWCVYDIIE